MSDPVSNEDIEDVLSSIRRLVSDEPIKGMPRRRSAEVDNVERFVLTPAFRVTDDAVERSETSKDRPSEQADQDNTHEFAETNNASEQMVREDTSTHDQQEHEESQRSEQDQHETRQEEIDLQPYQSDDEWQEPVPAENDRAVVEQVEDAHQNAEAEEPLEPEAAANKDGAPHSQDADNPSEAEEMQEHESHDGETHAADSEQDETEHSEAADPSSEFEANAQDDHQAAVSDAGMESLFPNSDSEPEEPGQAEAGEQETETVTAEAEAEPSEPPSELMQLADAGQNSLEARIAELEAALQNSAQEWEPDGSEEDLTDETRPISLDAQIKEDDGLAEAIASVAETLEAEDVATPANDWTPPSDDHGPAPIETLYAEEPADVAEVAASVEMPVEVMKDEPVEWRDLESERDAALEESLRVDAEGPLPDKEAVHNSSAMQAEALAAAHAAAKAAKENDLFAAEEPMMLDEEALQELVADIVRQELQGVLGERITRNVRRLVRREIKRALAMRDLE